MGFYVVIYSMGQLVASNIGYLLYWLYRNTLYYLPHLAPV